MAVKKVVYYIYAPQSKRIVAAASSRRVAKAIVEEYNKNTPSWHYNELYKYSAVVVRM